MIIDIGNPFSGTSIRVYGRMLVGSAGIMRLVLDGESTDDIVLNGTTINDEITPIYSAENLQDGDHQLWGNVSFQMGHGFGFGLDSLECVVTLTHSTPRAMC